jgi:hypothetical protein
MHHLMSTDEVASRRWYTDVGAVTHHCCSTCTEGNDGGHR